MDRETVQEHRAEANQHIEEAEARIAGQRARIAELAADGHDTMKANELLESFIATLETMQRHRETILSCSDLITSAARLDYSAALG